MVSIAIALVTGVRATSFANLTITPTWDSSITDDANAATIEGTIQAAINVYQADFADNINVFITFDENTTSLAETSTRFMIVNYADYLPKLTADQTTANDALAVASLAVGRTNPTNNRPQMRVATANLRAIGGITGVDASSSVDNPDATISLDVSQMNLDRTGAPAATKYDLMSVTMHEIDEALGWTSGLNSIDSNLIKPADLFRYDQNTNRTYDTASTVQAYFSINGGTNWLARFNQNNPPRGYTGPGDYGDWWSSNGLVQVQDAFGTPATQPNLGVELTALDVIGYDLVPEPTTIVLALGGMGLIVLGFFGKHKIRG